MLLDWSLAVAPLLLIILLMVRFRWGAARAGPAGWLAAVGIAALRFRAGISVLAVAHVRAAFQALDVLLIVWAAFLLYRVADEAGAIRILGKALPHLTADRGMQALLIGWAFASFLQGVGGFGVPVVVTAPILLGLGFAPLTAVMVPSIGHAWSVTFGSLASSFQALIAASGLPGQDLAPESAALLAAAGVVCGWMVARIADGPAGARRLVCPVLILGVVMGAVQYWLATRGLWNIAGFGGGLAGLAVGLFVARAYRGPKQDAAPVGLGTVAQALSGYAALVAITLVVQLVPSVRSALSGIALHLDLPATETGRGYAIAAATAGPIVLLRHAGAVLLYASAVAYGLYRWADSYSAGALTRIVTGTARGVLPSTIGIVSMVGLASVMSQSGMTDVLARGLAQSVGALFPVVAPWIGALGAFISGSNTSSNLLFVPLQQRTAELLHLRVTRILAAQTAGGAIGSVVAPTKIVVGVGSAGGGVSEGEVLRHLLVYVMGLVAFVSVVVWVWLWAGAR
jgi:lactate permease